MEWDAKTPSQWDWDSLALFSGKVCEISKPAQQSEWRVEGGREIADAAVYPAGTTAGSGSEMGNGCSSKSSISASLDSSSKAGIRRAEINFEARDGLPMYLNKSKELARVEDTGTSPAVVDVANCKEPAIGLKLGKRTYFEDVCAGSNAKSSSPSAFVTPSPAVVKKSRASYQSIQNAHCQVEGCNMDLTTAKDYHRKHRVCENHSKSAKVIVAGQERRFCQQCSRFHELSEFDQKKRSCRRRLSDHNARRRKPQPDTISFNSGRSSLSFFEDRQQVNLLWNRTPSDHARPHASSTWEGLCDFKLTQTKGSWIRSTKAGDISEQLHFPSIGPSNNVSSNSVSTLRHGLERLLPFKSTTAEILNQGLEASAVASNLDGAPDLRRALSLLSTDSWGSADPRPTSLVNFANANHNGAAQSAMHAASTTSEYWQQEQPLAQQARVLSFDLQSNVSQFQELQVLKAPFETGFFDSSQIH